MEAINIPALDLAAAKRAQEKFDKMPKAGPHLGKLEKMIVQYAAMQGDKLPQQLKPAMMLACGDHGIAKYGVSAFPQEVTLQMVNGYMRGTAGATVLARHCNADVYVVDVGTTFDLSQFKNVRHCKVAYGTEDFTQGPAMTREQAEQALEVGRSLAHELVEKGYNFLYTGEMGIANTTSTAAIASAFMSMDPLLTVGRGSGINDERMRIKRQVVIDGLAKNKPEAGNGMDVLCKVGGYDHAGLAGFIIGAAECGVPVMLDGVNATAAGLIAYGIAPACKNYLFCSHLSSDISHRKMLELLEMMPIVDAGMRLGEGTGASLAIKILSSALALYNKLGGSYA